MHLILHNFWPILPITKWVQHKTFVPANSRPKTSCLKNVHLTTHLFPPNNHVKPCHMYSICGPIGLGILHKQQSRQLCQIVIFHFINRMQFSFFSSCCLEKIHNLPFPSSINESSTPLQLTHTDLRGTSFVPSISGYKYYILFIDDYSKYTWIYVLRNKLEATEIFCNFKTQV